MDVSTGPLRIAFVITSLGTGGAETMLYKLIERMDRTRFSPFVVSLTDKGDFGARLEGIGVPVYAIGMHPGLPGPLQFRSLVKTLSAIRPGLIQTWMYHADLLGGLAGRLLGIKPLVWGIRHSDLSRANNKQATLAVVWLCARLSGGVPTSILSCSERARKVHVAKHYVAEKFAVIPNGFELDRFMPSEEARQSVRKELGLPDGGSLVGHIGRWNAQKNHRGLLEAFQAIHKQKPDVHFLLAGQDVELSNPALRELVNATGLSDRCHALGRRQDVPRLMAALDVLASSSHGEGFPNVVGEAMACEVPCVVTDVGDCAEIVGSTGRVVARGDMQGLATRVVELLEMPVQERDALGQHARARVASLYEIGDVVQRYERYYQGLMR